MTLIYNLDFINDKSKKSSIKKAISILERAYYQNIEQGSFFLDPFEQGVIKSIADKNAIDIIFIGANDKAERKIFVANPYFLPIEESNYISVLEFDHEGLSHPDVLGALMSLNISREIIGDIVLNNHKCEFAILSQEASFIKFNLSKIKNSRVDINYKKDNKLTITELNYSNHSGFVASLRLDNIVSEIIGTSRKKAKDIIRGKNVRINYEIIEDPSKLIKEDSLISVRKFGRFIFDEITGESKKGNLHITYRKIEWYI